MINYTFQEIKESLLKSINEYNCEAELSLFFNENPNEYMIIMYDDHCSFQRCGSKEVQSGEVNYNSLDELYKAQQIDNIILERDWENLKRLSCIDFDLFDCWEI